MARLLALDFGDKRIGVAISDELQITTRSLPAIVRQKNERFWDEIVTVAEMYKVEKIIVGMPYSLNGTKGPQAIKTDEFIAGLKQKTGLLVEIVDERYTSQTAEDMLFAEGTSFRKDKGLVDSRSAQLILSSYLNR